MPCPEGQEHAEDAAGLTKRCNRTRRDANAYLTRARANMMLQDYEEAIADTSQAILKPNFPAAIPKTAGCLFPEIKLLIA